MSMYYSYKTKGFYDANVHKERPEDSVEIAKYQYENLLDGIYNLGGEIRRGISGEPFIYLSPVPTDAELLATERTTMICTPLQGILTLGETEWAKIMNYRDTVATWAERVVIDSALDWRRNSQNIAFFQYLLGYTDEQVDDLFRAAMLVDA